MWILIHVLCDTADFFLGPFISTRAASPHKINCYWSSLAEMIRVIDLSYLKKGCNWQNCHQNYQYLHQLLYQNFVNIIDLVSIFGNAVGVFWVNGRGYLEIPNMHNFRSHLHLFGVLNNHYALFLGSSYVIQI